MQPGELPRTALPEAARTAFVRMRGITKSFYGARANDGVDFTLQGGEIHALLGENGAGKSTLMNVLTGLYQPDSGEIAIEGHARRIASPADAIEAGIGMVHQHFKLVPAFTVAENIHLGWNETPFRLDPATLAARTRALSERYGLAVSPGARVADLSAGEQQRVEILRVLARGARIVVLDEPTAVLTPPEVRALFDALRAFRAAGNAVILISHKLGEVLEIADTVTVMRGGRSVATGSTEGASRSSLARLIIGDTVLPDAIGRVDAAASVAQAVPLALRGVSVRDGRGVLLLDGVDLDLRAGEILGIAGVAGNGQRALSEVLTGCIRPDAGEVLLDGAPAGARGARGFADWGVGHIPEDRLRTALAADLPLGENAVLRDYRGDAAGKGPFLFPRRLAALARRIIDDAAVNLRDSRIPARNLSGGNQQRLVAERERRIASRVLVAAYPTRGLDVGAVAALHAGMQRLRASGVGVVLISEEIDELLAQADRIAVLFAGRIAGILPVAEADGERLGLLMSGQAVPEPVS